MRIVPSLPPPTGISGDELAVTTSTRVKSAEPVQARATTTMVARHPAGPLPEMEERGRRNTMNRMFTASTGLTVTAYNT